MSAALPAADADHEDRCDVTAQRTADRLAAQVERVRELHFIPHHRPIHPDPVCCCGAPFPCPTIRALDGEAER